jgi:preprotein translocase subunit SecE
VARNRKRRNDRRPRRPAEDPSARPGVATARGQRSEPVDRADSADRSTPADHGEPLDGGKPADRGERADRGEPAERGAPADRSEPVDESPEALRHGTPDVELAEAQLAIGRPELGDVQPADGEDEDGFDDIADDQAPPPDEESRGRQLSSRAETAPAPRGAGRLVHFLQGSWRELQRVQWPDRRQVMQATGVVIGFVIVAGLFLGAADWAAQKIVTFILK